MCTRLKKPDDELLFAIKVSTSIVVFIAAAAAVVIVAVAAIEFSTLCV